MGALVKDKSLYGNLNAAAGALNDDAEALKHNWLLRGFFKNRGYLDSTELTKHEIAELPKGPELKRFTYTTKDLFEKSDTAKLKNQKSLNQAGGFLEQNKFGLAVVIVSSGLKGDLEENQLLTRVRAMVVRQYLADKFKVDDTKLKTKGVGEQKARKLLSPDSVAIIIYGTG